jgi:hypothetical protein
MRALLPDHEALACVAGEAERLIAAAPQGQQPPTSADLLRTLPLRAAALEALAAAGEAAMRAGATDKAAAYCGRIEGLARPLLPQLVAVAAGGSKPELRVGGSRWAAAAEAALEGLVGCCLDAVDALSAAEAPHRAVLLALELIDAAYPPPSTASQALHPPLASPRDGGAVGLAAAVERVAEAASTASGLWGFGDGAVALALALLAARGRVDSETVLAQVGRTGQGAVDRGHWTGGTDAAWSSRFARSN